MSAMDENKNFWSKMNEEQKRLDEERSKQEEELSKITADMILKALGIQQEEDPVTKTLNEVSDRIEAFSNKRSSVSITTKDIRSLEEVCPEFVAATQTGFSEEEVKHFIVRAFDALFGALNIGKLENTLSNVLISVALEKKIDFSQFSGIGIYNYLRNKKSFSKYLEPEYKKKIIFGEAIKIAVEAKTISFNTAVKRAIRKINEEGFTPKFDEEDREFIDDISGIINPLIDLYIDNEMDILAAIMSKKK